MHVSEPIQEKQNRLAEASQDQLNPSRPHTGRAAQPRVAELTTWAQSRSLNFYLIHTLRANEELLSF